MASNWGNKESLEEARRFRDQVSNSGCNRGRNRGRQGQGGGSGPSNTAYHRSPMNNKFNSSSIGEQDGDVQGARGGFFGLASGTNSGVPSLATAPPAHPFFNSRPGSDKPKHADGHNVCGQPPVDDAMDIDELLQAPTSSLTGSGWNSAQRTSTNRTAVQAPTQASATTKHHGTETAKSHLRHSVASNTTLGTRPLSPTLGMGYSIWAAPTVTSTIPAINNDPPIAPTKTIIDNDWQTTYAFEENGRLYKIAADNADRAGDIMAEQQLRKVEKLFKSIVEARQTQDEARERTTRADVRGAVARATSAFNKFKHTKPAQQTRNIGGVQEISTARQEQESLMQPRLGQRDDQVLPQSVQPIQHAQPLQHEQPLQRAPVPASTGNAASPPQGSLQGLGGRSRFDDPEALRLWNDFLKRGN